MCMHCVYVNNVLTPDRQARGQSVESERSPVIVDPPQPVKPKRNTRGRTAKESTGRFIDQCSVMYYNVYALCLCVTKIKSRSTD